MNNIFKYEYLDLNTKNMVTMYFVEKSTTEIDVVITYSNNEVGNQVLNLNYPAKSVALTQFANTKKGYSFIQLTKINGNWVYKSRFNTNVYYTSNTTVPINNLVPNEGIVVANNVTLTIQGSGNLNETSIAVGNNAIVKFTSGTVLLNNATFQSINKTDIFSVEVLSPAKIQIPNSSVVRVEGEIKFNGNRLQIDQGGELEIKDGTVASFSDSFQFYNYGTLRVGQGVTMNLKNLNNYTSSNTLINTGNGTRTTLNISSGGVVYLNGLATVKGTTFKKKTTSNFSRVDLSGSVVRTFENVQIEGSQYGFHVSNVPSGKVYFTNVTGYGKFYSTIKATNSHISVNGIITNNSVQDGLSAYSSSYVSLSGYQSYGSSLIGIRSAQYSTVETVSPGAVDISGNTRGIHVYTYGGVHLTGTPNELLTVWLNDRPDNVYGGLLPYDLYAVLDGSISLNYYNNWTLFEYEDEANLTQKTNGVPSNGGGFSQNSSLSESLEIAHSSNRKASKSDVLKAYRALKKTEEQSGLREAFFRK